MAPEIMELLITSSPAGIYIVIICSLALYTYNSLKQREAKCSQRLEDLVAERDSLKDQVSDLKRQLDNLSLRLELLQERGET